jgi:hypothetical protein
LKKFPSKNDPKGSMELQCSDWSLMSVD